MPGTRYRSMIGAAFFLIFGCLNVSVAAIPVDDVAAVADVTGDAVPDVAVFVETASARPAIGVFSGVSGTLHSTIDSVNDKWQGYALAGLRDADQDGTADDPGVSKLVINQATGRIRVETRCLDDGAFLGSIQFTNDKWTAVDVVVVDDLEGDGMTNDTAIAVLGRRQSDGRIQLQLRDFVTGNLISNVIYLNANWTPVAAAVADRSAMAPAGTLQPLIGVIAEHPSNGR